MMHSTDAQMVRLQLINKAIKFTNVGRRSIFDLGWSHSTNCDSLFSLSFTFPGPRLVDLLRQCFQYAFEFYDSPTNSSFRSQWSHLQVLALGTRPPHPTPEMGD